MGDEAKSADAKPVKVAVLSRLFGVTERRVQQLAAAGVVIKSGRGTYDLAKSIHGYIQYLQAQIDGRPSVDVAQRIAGERYRAIKHANDLKEGEIYTRAEVDELTSVCFASVARIADSLCSRLPPLLGRDKSAAQRRLIIRNEVSAIREAAARDLRTLAGAIDPGGHHKTPPGKNGRRVGGPERRPPGD